MIRELEKNIVGFIGVKQSYIEGIFIDINNQNNGKGKFLLDKIKENKNNLKLSVYKKNVNAIKFYEKTIL